MAGPVWRCGTGALVPTIDCSPLADPVPKPISYRMNSRNLRPRHILLRNQFRGKVHVFGAGRQEKSIYISASEIIGIDSGLFKEPRGQFSI